MSNFTVDDTASILAYSAGWGISSSSDQTLPQYFESTYHATRSLRAHVNLAFSGTAIYLFGSKGPMNGNYSVLCDGTLYLFSGQQTNQAYLQPLFSLQLQDGQHSITLSNTDVGGGWLDLDFVTVTGSTGNSTPTPVQFSSTISPLPFTLATSSTTPTPFHSKQSSPASSSTPTSVSSAKSVPVAVVIALGAVLAFLIAGVAIYVIRKCFPRPQVSKPIVMVDEKRNRSITGSAFFEPLPPPMPQTYDPRTQRNCTSSPLTTVDEGSDRSTGALSPASHSRSPLAGPFRSPFRSQAKSDGTDSTKSTFLQV